jgi:hypothetical protein
MHERDPDVDNAAFIERELDWLREIIDLRFQAHAGESVAADLLAHRPPPSLPDHGSAYADVVRELSLDAAERLVLVLAYAPHVCPGALDAFLVENKSLNRRFTEFGGLTGLSHGGFLPTGETAMFLLAGSDLAARLRLLRLFAADHRLHARGVLQSARRHPDEPALASGLCLGAEVLERLTTGRPYHPPFSAEFPASRIATPYAWSDLVLDGPTRQEVEDIVAWTKYETALLDGWGLRKRLKPGFRALFTGPPGTGKTMTACLLGKATSLPVYRIDLSRVVSKYIGETEKNLASLFDRAEDQRWILFFDEADSLFGRRTESRNANDRAANQQISYLLQRVEEFPGVVILASNLRAHIDEAFSRRFQAIVLFRMPTAAQRRRLWAENFKDKPYRLAPEVDLVKLANDHELSGGSIINVLRFACLRAVARDPQEVQLEDVLAGVRRELLKEGKLSM